MVVILQEGMNCKVFERGFATLRAGRWREEGEVWGIFSRRC